jgi:hypothetical protein
MSKKSKKSVAKPAPGSLDRKDAAKRQAPKPAPAPAPAPAKPVPAAAKARAKGLAGLMESYLDRCASKHSEGYARSLSRPLGAFVEWCQSRGLVSPKALDAKALERYRKFVEGQDRALATKRMDLARVQTFLRASGLVQGDLAVLRIALTPKEKKHQAELAEQREGGYASV